MNCVEPLIGHIIRIFCERVWPQNIINIIVYLVFQLLAFLDVKELYNTTPYCFIHVKTRRHKHFHIYYFFQYIYIYIYIGPTKPNNQVKVLLLTSYPNIITFKDISGLYNPYLLRVYNAVNTIDLQ